MVRCEECGLLDRSSGNNYCVRFKREITAEELAGRDECNYFYKIIKEDGEPLSVEYHLILQDEEIKNRKLKMK